MNDFQREFVDTGAFVFEGGFREYVLRINKNEPSESFAATFLADSLAFAEGATAFRSVPAEKVAVTK